MLIECCLPDWAAQVPRKLTPEVNVPATLSLLQATALEPTLPTEESLSVDSCRVLPAGNRQRLGYF
jgi:hypothetical protein